MLVSLLVRLKAGSAARNTLRMRSQVIKSHIRNIRFEGNISTHIGDLAIVCFTGIKHTADWFLASFKENDVASCKFDISLSERPLISLDSFHWLGQEGDGGICRDFSENKSLHQMWTKKWPKRTHTQSKKVGSTAHYRWWFHCSHSW